MHIRIECRQARKSKWNRAQIAVGRSIPDTLVSPPGCPANLIELLLIQRMKWMDYPKFPNWAILLWCSLLYSRSAFIGGPIIMYFTGHPRGAAICRNSVALDCTFFSLPPQHLPPQRRSPPQLPALPSDRD